MLTRHGRGKRLVAQRSANASNLIRGNRSADARTTEEYTQIGTALTHGRGNVQRDSRVIHGLRTIGAAIDYQVSQRRDLGTNRVFITKSGVVYT
jgi:hypothetical protein